MKKFTFEEERLELRNPFKRFKNVAFFEDFFSRLFSYQVVRIKNLDPGFGSWQVRIYHNAFTEYGSATHTDR
jgi:hypothetical protein